MTSHWKGKKLSEEHRKKLSEAAKGRVGYWNGKTFSEEHRENLSKSHTGIHINVTRTMPERSEIHRKRISRALKKWWKKHKQKTNKV